MLDLIVGIELWAVVPSCLIYRVWSRRPVRRIGLMWVDAQGRRASRYINTSRSGSAGWPT